MTRDQIVEAARKHLGTPYAHQGRMAGVQLDCAGLVILTGRDLGLTIDDPEVYSEWPDGRLTEHMDRNFLPLPVKDAGRGDILVFYIGESRRLPQHLAVLTGVDPLMMIHAYSGSGCVVETTLGHRWEKRILTAYRYPGLSD